MEQVPDYLRRSTLRAELQARREEKQKTYRIEVARVAAVAILSLLLVTGAFTPNVVTYERPQYVIPDACELESVVCEGEEGYNATALNAYVTGYNTVPEQTDATPCIAASGDNICGRRDVVACPTYLPLGTRVEIDSKVYTCLDRTAEKYDGRYDISCDKDTACPKRVTGHKTVLVYKQ